MLDQYILDENGEPKKCRGTGFDAMMEWAEWMCASGGEMLRVAKDVIGDWEISTVFLPIDHNHFGDGPPILWETMLFGPENSTMDCARMRCGGSREQALAMHARAVARVRAHYAKSNRTP